MANLKKTWITSLMLVLLLMICLPAPVQAAKKTLQNQSWTQKEGKARKKAKLVKTGTTIVKMPSKGKGFLRFKAAKDGTYTFTLSELKLKIKKKKQQFNGYFYVMTRYGNKGKKIGQDMLKTQGGRTNTLWLATKKKIVGEKYNWELKSRYGKIKLQKGQTVYLYFNFTPKATLKLNIAHS